MESIARREERLTADRVLAGFAPRADSRAGSLPLNTPERRALLAFGDAVAGGAGCFFAYLAWDGLTDRPLSLHFLGPLFFALTWVLALFMVDGYDVQIPASRVRSLVVVLKAVPLTSLCGFLVFFARPYAITRPVIAMSVGIGGVLVVATRLTIARALLHERFAKRVILVTAGRGISPVLTEILDSARFEYRVVAAVDISRKDGVAPGNGTKLNDLLALMRRQDAHEVIVANDEPVAVQAALEVCFSNGVRVLSTRDLVERFAGRVPLSWVDESWFLTLPAATVGSRPYIAFRRLVDTALAGLIGFAFLFVLPFIAAAIKLDSRGPVFFRQRRVGQYGREFSIPKLRSMRSDAELGGHQWAEREDPRVTRVGRFLRLTRLDEVPQVLSVLRGEMSFIGPRPERPEFVAELEHVVPHYRARLAVKPGISGWAQVKGGYAGSIAESARKLEYDLYYVKNQSLRLDLQIILHTLFTVLGLRGR